VLAVELPPNNTVPGEYHPPPKHLVHDTSNKHNTRAVSLSHQEESSGDNASQLPKHDTIGQLAHELDAQREGRRDWAREMEMELKGTTQGEYIQAGYMDPTPAPPPPAPWSPSQPPTSDYPPPRTCYGPPHTYYQPRRTHSHPHSRPPHTGHDTSETRTGHVTATRPVRNHLIARLRPPPWPYIFHHHYHCPHHHHPYILQLRPLPWPPPTPTSNNRPITIASSRYSTQGKTTPWILFVIFYFLYIKLTVSAHYFSE